jgi:hypothetical protein
MHQTAAAWVIASLFGNAGPRPRLKSLPKPIQRRPLITGQTPTVRNGRQPWAATGATPEALEDSTFLPATQKHMAREEARGLLKLVGKNGETVDTVRDLIGIDGRLERKLLTFIERNRLDAPWVRDAMTFRAIVLEEFNRLAKNAGHGAAAEAEVARRPIRMQRRSEELVVKIGAEDTTCVHVA